MENLNRSPQNEIFRINHKAEELRKFEKQFNIGPVGVVGGKNNNKDEAMRPQKFPRKRGKRRGDNKAEG